MYLIRFQILLLVAACFSGCTAHSIVSDYKLYDTGKPKSEGTVFSKGTPTTFGYTSEYFKNGQLKSEQWLQDGRPFVKLTFYENGRLKSEERFYNDEITYAKYYAEDGKVYQTIGERLSWRSK